LFGLQTAKLSRAGDDGDARSFIAPDTSGLNAALATMRPSAEPSVLQPDPTVTADGAYPLASLSYAMIRPLDHDDAARKDYAAFIRYAAGPGQKSGLALGELPPGYATLPPELRQQASDAADLVETMTAPAAAEAPAAGAGAGTQPSSGSSSSGTATLRTARTTLAPTPDGVESALVEPVAAAAGTPDAGPLTPILALARNRFFIPALAAVWLLATLAALEITKRPRRVVGRPTVPEDPA
jgi:hypothetical protein